VVLCGISSAFSAVIFYRRVITGEKATLRTAEKKNGVWGRVEI